MVTTIELVSKKKYKDAVMFVGLPGIGLVGKIAVDYLLKELKAKKIGEVFSDSFPPSVYTEKGIVNMITDSFYAVEIKKKHYIFLAGPVQPILNPNMPSTSGEHYEFAKTIIKTAQNFGVKEIYTLAGVNIGEKRLSSTPHIIVSATDNKTLTILKKLGAKPGLEDGLISGAAGLILGEAKKTGIKGACIMGETNARLIYGDHGSAKKLVEFIVKKYGFKIKMKGIAQEAKNIEKAFVQLSKQLEQRKTDNAEKHEFEEHGPSYVR